MRVICEAYASLSLSLSLSPSLSLSLSPSLSTRNLGVTDCGLRRGNNCPTCAQFLNNTLTEGQAEKCYADSAPIEAIASGSRSAIIECQAQFADKQWNCSTFFSHLLFGKFVAEGQSVPSSVSMYYIHT